VRELVRQFGILKTKNVPAAELRRAKLTLEKEIVFSDETAEGRAKTLGYFQLTHGAFEEEERYRSRILSVTDRELTAVAHRYFDFSKLSVALLLPRQEALPAGDEVLGWIDAEPRGSKVRGAGAYKKRK
jgi:predicted Zn-dependent peptidase